MVPMDQPGAPYEGHLVAGEGVWQGWHAIDVTVFHSNESFQHLLKTPSWVKAP